MPGLEKEKLFPYESTMSYDNEMGEVLKFSRSKQKLGLVITKRLGVSNWTDVGLILV